MISTLYFPNLFIHNSLLVIAALILLTAAVSDVRKFIISNKLCLALVALFPFYVLTAPVEISWLQHLGIASMVLAIGFGMFALRLLGGGDVKMLAAAALWAGPKLIATLLVYTAIAGGVLAVIFATAALMKKLTARRELAPAYAWHKAPVPYGVAIACGGIYALATLTHGIF